MATKEDIYATLGYLGFQRFLPRPVLRPYVSCYWSIACPAPLPRDTTEYLYPDGGTGFTFCLDGTLTLDSHAITPVGLFNGFSPRVFPLLCTGRVAAFGVRFRPGGLVPFYQGSLAELTDAHVSLDTELFGDMRPLHDRLHAKGSMMARVRLMDDWLGARLQCHQRLPHNAVCHALDSIQQSGGQQRIRAIADSAGLSIRQLERRFRDEVGITPKGFSRVIRVDVARSRLKEVPACSGAELGLAGGYFDQAHFIREFTRIVGVSPEAYRKRRARAARTRPWSA